MGIRDTINNIVHSAVADSLLQHVGATGPRAATISENPPRVDGWRQCSSPGEPTWSAPPWSGQADRDYQSKMSAICFALRHQKLEYDLAIREHRRRGESYEFTSKILPGDLQSLPLSIAADAKRLLKMEGWL